MLVLIFWAAAVGIGVVLLGSIGYGLVGHLSRLRRGNESSSTTVEATLSHNSGNLLQTQPVEALRFPSPRGRHRAG